ncbi:MAG: DNA mismatch repair protein MutS [Sphaerochaetaceae bacterium]
MEPNIATPMMEQYLSLKQEHQDEVLFFRLGDFYEMFLDDAKEVSQILNITLTSRNGVPMCGIPYHAATGYIKRLLDAGKKVAICEQTEMPGQGRSIAKREVVQIISPGTAVEEEFLDETKTSYLLAISFHKEAIYCAYSDVSSGVLHLVDLPYEKKLEALYSLVEQLQPNELLLNEEDYFSFALFAAFVDEQSMAKTRLPAWYFSQSQGLSLLSSHMGTLNLKQFGLQDDSLLLEAAGALFRYLQHTAKNSLIHLQTLTLVEQNDYLLIDEASRKNLELLHNLQDGSEQRTLYSALNKTTTRGGSRLLKEWIASPLASLAAITHRQQWVEWFFEQNDERGRVRSLLAKVRDVNRLATRVSMNRSQPQDLVAIANAIQCFFELTEVHQERYLSLLGFHVESKNMENIVDLMDLIFRSINSEVRGSYEIGNVITTGFNSELDAKRSLAQKGFDAVGEYVEKLKQETGINAIKTGQNKIIGYYVEISKLHSKAVPPFLFRKQTLVNAERYTTEELSLLEQEINSATDQAAQLERKLYDQIVESCKEHTATLLSLGLFFSTLDVLQSLAHVAHSEHYCKPLMVEEDVLVIEEGRHPVVEQHLKRGEFVANSIDLTATDRRF